MTWRCFRLSFELLSPLHIGYLKVGSVQRTRHYVPARNLLAATAELLTRKGFSADGAARQDHCAMMHWVREEFAFSYFFVQEGTGRLNPHYVPGGLRYGCGGSALSRYDFEHRYLSAHVTTAIQADSGAADDESLHEVEVILPTRRDAGLGASRTQLTGWAFIHEAAVTALGDETGIRCWLSGLQVGGERRYGFGRLGLSKLEPSDHPAEDCREWQDQARPRLRVKKGTPLLAHAPTNHLRASGMIEPLVGRETGRDSSSFGRVLTRGRVCWAPGSTCDADQWFEIAQDGLWVPVE